jgi:hypothetical protein
MPKHTGKPRERGGKAQRKGQRRRILNQCCHENPGVRGQREVSAVLVSVPAMRFPWRGVFQKAFHHCLNHVTAFSKFEKSKLEKANFEKRIKKNDGSQNSREIGRLCLCRNRAQALVEIRKA